MKNIHVLPTDKPSKLFNCFGKLEIGDYVTTRENLQVTNQNIYITNDEEIKYGDYRYSLIQNNIVFVTGFTLKVNKEYWKLNNHTHKKIILTTDQDLIKDDVQAIDDEFLEWFVKNPSYEEVEVETYFKKIGVETDANGYRLLDVLGKYYKIIIPKEIR